MNDPRTAFYLERDRRSRQYGSEDSAVERPVKIIVGEDVADTRSGQITALALINMVARVHRRVALFVPSAPLLATPLAAGTDLRTAAAATARAIDPFMDLDSVEDIGGDRFVATIGLGSELPRNLDLYLGWRGGLGILDTAPASIDHDPHARFGAATAAILGAAGLFRLAHHQRVRAARLNPLTLATGNGTGDRDQPRPIDVGSCLTVGAGAVTCALCYWLREFGVRGEWDVVDRDIMKLHNTNRCLTCTAADAGWPNGIPGGVPAAKATSAAAAIGARAFVAWYDEWQPSHDTRHDLVLALANGRGVRSLLAQRGEPVLLHATTSANWTAELHRHLPDRDDCPACRIPDNAQPQMMCATGPATPEEPDSPDAALPFLSAAAGLLLAAALAEMPDAAALARPQNHWQLDLTLGGRLLRPLQHPAREGCRHVQTRTIRKSFQDHEPRRWDYLDQ